jgi:8-oxo-dGTP pyrophosphatase MutT (NUDIX family)
VLVALFEDGGATRVVLTRRAGHLRRNRGEIAFPGGRIEPGEDPATAALREAHEEVALEPGAVEVIGELSPLQTVSQTGFIQPVVGLLAARPPLVANPDEVAEVFDVGLATLADPAVFREEIWERPDGSKWPIWFYDVCDPPVWGATARILHELLDVAKDGGGAQ